MTPFLRKHHALVSWAVLATSLIVLLALLVAPVFEQYDRYRFELLKDGRTLQRLQSVAASRQELEQASGQFQQRNLREWVFPAGQEADAIVLAIQKRVSDTLTGSSATVRSVAPLRTSRADEYVAVGVTVQFNGSLAVVLEALRELEQSRPLLIVEDLRLLPSVSRIHSPGGQPQVLEAIMSVVTYLPVPAPDAGANP